jgi:hypothetical protein
MQALMTAYDSATICKFMHMGCSAGWAIGIMGPCHPVTRPRYRQEPAEQLNSRQLQDQSTRSLQVCDCIQKCNKDLKTAVFTP